MPVVWRARRGRPGRLLGTRELTATSPYLLVYTITGPNIVTILRLWHAAQEHPRSP